MAGLWLLMGQCRRLWHHLAAASWLLLGLSCFQYHVCPCPLPCLPAYLPACSLPFLRTTSALRTFNGALARCQHDLEEWRARSACSGSVLVQCTCSAQYPQKPPPLILVPSPLLLPVCLPARLPDWLAADPAALPSACPLACRSGLPARQTAILDANDGAGWDLAASLLRPREVVTDDAGGVKFVNTGKAPRLGTAAALKHPFIRAAAGAQQAAAAAAAAAPAASSNSSGRGGGSRPGSRGDKAAAAAPASKAAGGGMVASMWGRLKNSLFDMEARVMQEATATEVQTGVVEALRKDVKAGRASEAELRQQESRLAGMQRTLQSSVKDMNSAYGAARGFLSGMLGSSGSRGQRAEAANSSGGSSGSRGSSSSQAAAPEAPTDRRMPKWAAKEVPLKKVDASLYASQQRQSSSGDYDSDTEAAQAAEARAEAMGAAVGDAVSTAAGMFSQGLVRASPAAATAVHAIRLLCCIVAQQAATLAAAAACAASTAQLSACRCCRCCPPDSCSAEVHRQRPVWPVELCCQHERSCGAQRHAGRR